jgi:tetratricopeptide (TPR) repeat protein
MTTTPDDLVELGRRVRELRRARGLNQQDLASDEISVSYISLIETGKRSPSDAVLTVLAERLNCTVEYLRSGRDGERMQELELKIAFADMAMRNGDNGEALQAYSEALAARPLLTVEMTLRAQVGQALALEKLGRLEAAAHLLGELAEDARVVVGSPTWTQVHVALCRCHRELGDFSQAVSLGEQTLRRLESLGLELTDDHIQLGATLIDCYRLRGDLAKAHLLAQRLIRRSEESGSRVARGAVYWNAALVARSRGELAEAVALAERALALMAESDNLRHQAMLKCVYAELLLHDPASHRPREALELVVQAQDPLASVGTAAEQGWSEMLLARAHLQLADPDQAVAHANRALGLQPAELRWETVEARTVLAEAWFQGGETEQAVATLTSAARQLEQIPPGRGTAERWRHIADVWHRLGSDHEALTAYRRALDDIGLPAAPATPVATVSG